MDSYISTRASRSSPNTRTLIKPCASRLASISFKTEGVKPASPIMTTGFNPWASERSALRSAGVSFSMMWKSVANGAIDRHAVRLKENQHFTRMAKNKLNKNWLHDHLNDPYVKLAQKEGYRARAAYKLKEIDESEKLIRPGQVIVDLGCTPGSWGQYVRRKLSGKDGGGINGTIIGLDLLPMEPIADMHYIQGDFREQEVLGQ